MPKSQFMHTRSESKYIFAIEQKAIDLCYVKNVAFLLGHPYQYLYSKNTLFFTVTKYNMNMSCYHQATVAVVPI